jgi:FKBP-type peptidyl-prolyl cis-trans isomerase
MNTEPCFAAAIALLLLPLPTPAAAKTKPSPTCTSKTASGLGYTILDAGTGAVPSGGDEVKVKYRGTLAATGKEFDASNSADFPVDGVIPGFSEGLKLMHTGGKARLCIPAALGYGAQGTGPIPANADLVFEVTLLGVKPGLLARAPSSAPVPAGERVCTSKTASGLGYAVSEAGTGESPTAESVVLVNYRGYLASNGSIFDANNATPFPVKSVIAGFGEGLKLMQRGGRSKFCIPAALAYGAAQKATIPANSDLVFDVDLLDFKSLAEIQGMQRVQQPAAAAPSVTPPVTPNLKPAVKPVAAKPRPRATKRKR